MLWDCGSSHPGLGLLELPRAVRALGAWKVPAVLITHPNLDHFLCLPDVVAPLGIRRVYVTQTFLDAAAQHPRGASATLIRELHARDVDVIELHAGSALQLGATRCDIISPQAGAVFTEDNDTSLVGLFHIPTDDAERRVLLTGDIGPGAIARISGAFPDLHADVMEAPHHGSAKPEAMAFVQRIDPAVVLQSTGPQRVGDRRWDAVKTGRDWHITATDGACWAEILRDGTLRSGALRADRERR
jgi:competence protein ComEC